MVGPTHQLIARPQGSLASELWQVLLPLPGRPVLSAKFLFILQGPTQMLPPLGYPSPLCPCCHSTVHTSAAMTAQSPGQWLTHGPRCGEVTKGQTWELAAGQQTSWEVVRTSDPN